MSQRPGRPRAFVGVCLLIALNLCVIVAGQSAKPGRRLGREQAIEHHLEQAETLRLSPAEIVAAGRKLFEAVWTDQDGAGRPFSKGTGKPLGDSTRPLRGARAYNRVSGPDANSCYGCHNLPFAIAGGSGDVVTNAFVGADRFDFVTFDRADTRPTRGSVDEAGKAVTLQSVGNFRSTPGLLGAGYIELLAREMSEELQNIRDGLRPGQSRELMAKGVRFGVLARRANGSWDVSGVAGLPPQSLAVTTPAQKPSLVIRPWRQSGTAASLREMINESYSQHLGIQTVERFGVNTDPDRDGVSNEMTRGDVTAVAMFIASLPVPGQVVPNNLEVEREIFIGERRFNDVGCASCHVPSLPLKSAVFSEVGGVSLDLAHASLPQPRVAAVSGGVVNVPLFSDLKLHDITDPADPNAQEPLDINQSAGSISYRAGNRRFLTARLWGAGNQPPYFHTGFLTTLKESVLAHAGEALLQRKAFQQLTAREQNSVLAFLTSLQVLPPGTAWRTVDERVRPKPWPPASFPGTDSSR